LLNLLQGRRPQGAGGACPADGILQETAIMPTVPLVLPTRAPARPHRLGWLGRIVALWRFMRDRSLERRSVAALHGLDERTLQDLGIARAEIDALVRVRVLRRSSML
jgi:uncharacterized protein YjiS (DUF1127 family)